MSNQSRFTPAFTAGQQRFHVNNTNTITGYVKCDGSVVAQATYPSLYSAIGLIPDSNVLTTWTVQSQPFNGILSATYGASVFLASGYSNSLATSTDGVTWTSRNPSFSPAQTIYGSDFGGGIFIIGGDAGGIATSTDGITWTVRTSGTASAIQGVAYGNSLYVFGGAGGILKTSTNAITWTTRTTGTTQQINEVKYLNSQWVYVGENNTLATSTDAITWTLRSAFAFGNNTTANLTDISYGNGLYVYVASLGVTGYSTDAVSWITTKISGGSDQNRVNYFGNIFIMSRGSDGYYSYDGTTWPTFTSGSSFNINGFAFNGSTVLGAGSTSISNGYLATAAYYTYDSTTNFKLPTTSTGIISTNATTPTAYIKVK